MVRSEKSRDTTRFSIVDLVQGTTAAWAIRNSRDPAQWDYHGFWIFSLIQKTGVDEIMSVSQKHEYMITMPGPDPMRS